MKIAFSNDHAGVPARGLIDTLKGLGHEVIDYGVASKDSVDYPLVAEPALEAFVSGKVDRIVLVCGSGVGMSIVANRVEGIRCVLATDLYSAEMSRKHNNTNCIALRSRGEEDPKHNEEILSTWLATEFEGGRHERRVNEIETVGKACSVSQSSIKGETK